MRCTHCAIGLSVGRFAVFGRHRLQMCGGFRSPAFQSIWSSIVIFSLEDAILIVQVLHGARNLETILDEDL